jgi:hypothetical protein
MDKVKIESIKNLFTTPNALAEKVVEIELKKEGVFDAKIINSEEISTPLKPSALTSAISTIPSYDIEYKIDSSRGENHYNVRALVYLKKLFVFTAQCKESSFNVLGNVLKDTINSLIIIDEKNNGV